MDSPDSPGPGVPESVPDSPELPEFSPYPTCSKCVRTDFDYQYHPSMIIGREDCASLLAVEHLCLTCRCCGFMFAMAVRP